MTSDAAIRVMDLQKSFKDVDVLRGVDFDVAPGSIFALLGSNGAGKTTLVRILSTLLKADGGTATVHGHDVAAAYAGKRWIDKERTRLTDTIRGLNSKDER